MFPKITVNICTLANPVNLIYNLARLILPLIFFLDGKKEQGCGKTLQKPDENTCNGIFPKFSKKLFFKNCFFTLICLIILIASGTVFEYTASFFKGETEIEPAKISVTTLLAFLVPVIFYAASEEVLYRLYLPETMYRISASFKPREKTEHSKEHSTDKKNPPQESTSKTGNLPGEILSILIFAIAHYQGGILPVLNALVCGTALRICLILSKSLFPCILSHGLYNFILYFSLYSKA